MSTIETILSRMMNEPAFADAIFSNPEEALAEYDLSPDEISKFRELTREKSNPIQASLEERKSFASAHGHGGGQGAGKVSMHDISM